jgi:presenilin-like A22 family membrane protease
MSRGIKILAPVLAMLIFLMAVQIFALYITPPQSTHDQTNSTTAISEGKTLNNADKNSPIFVLIFVAIILVFTGFLLFAIKLLPEWVIEGFIWICMAISIYYVLETFLEPQMPFLEPQIFALMLTFGLLLLLRFYPEWYVIDTFCILICAAISSVFGMNMFILPTLLLLVIMAIYDAISVYKTGHMVSLAEIMIKIKAPLLFVLPKSKGYSFRRDRVSISSKKDRRSQAYFLGLGDAIIPTILVISANYCLTVPPIYINFGIKLPALGAMIGTYLGFLILIAALSDRYHAGLPFLNTGAILGFLAGCIIAGVRPF